MSDPTAPSPTTPLGVTAGLPVPGELASIPNQYRRPRKKIRWVEAIVIHVIFIAIAIFFLAPFIWMFLAAFEPHAEPFISWPKAVTLNNFTYIFRELDFARNLWNSIFVSVTSMIVTTFTVALAGYSLSRIEFKQKNWASYSILLLQTMPLSATMVPIYSLARQLGLRNSYFGLILVSVALDLPFLMWLMKGFFDAVPRSLEEAAWIDGRSKLRAWFEIVLPSARPGLAVVAGLSFLGAWAEVMLVLILIDSPSKTTVPLAFYKTMMNRGGYTEVRYELIAAMGVLYVIPVLAIFFATRKVMASGLASSTKGI
ncbi:MAG: carbohydrate ABC transporter permease [Thermomicrobiales bacterium]